MSGNTIETGTTTLSFQFLDEALKKSQEKPKTPIIEKIGDCESGNGRPGSAHQFNPDGSVVRGKVDRDDIGKYQINEYYHGLEALRLGYDIYTLEGNTAYAYYLYRTQGVQPWSASAYCWNK